MHSAERGHTHNFVLAVGVWRQASQCVIVGIVHGHYQVKVVEVTFAHRSRTVFQTVAAPCCVHSHAFVGQFAGMSAVSAGRINRELSGQTFGINQMLHYTLCGRRPAYIAQAYEEDAYFLFIFQRSGYILHIGCRIIFFVLFSNSEWLCCRSRRLCDCGAGIMAFLFFSRFTAFSLFGGIAPFFTRQRRFERYLQS